MISTPAPRRGKESAVSIVQNLAFQGKSEREIIMTLKSQGYDNEEISKALNIVLKRKVTGDPQPQLTMPRASVPQSPAPSGFEFIAPEPPSPPQQIPTEGERFIEMTEEEEIGLEELIEEIIDEKWISIDKEMANIEKFYIQLEEQIKLLNERLNKFEEKKDEKEQELKNMLTESASHIESIETRVGSVERAFKEFLPTLTENVRSLSGIVNKMKGKTTEEPPKETNA